MRRRVTLKESYKHGTLGSTTLIDSLILRVVEVKHNIGINLGLGDFISAWELPVSH